MSGGLPWPSASVKRSSCPSARSLTRDDLLTQGDHCLGRRGNVQHGPPELLFSARMCSSIFWKCSACRWAQFCAGDGVVIDFLRPLGSSARKCPSGANGLHDDADVRVVLRATS